MISDQDVARLRQETVGLDAPDPFRHFNHSGASLPSKATMAAIHAHLDLEARIGPMEAANIASDTLPNLRARLAQFIGASTKEVSFTASGSSAWGQAFAALPQFAPGDRILVSRQEWGGNVATIAAAAQRSGARIEVMPSCADGTVDIGALTAQVQGGAGPVRLLALTWLPANGGLIHPAAAVGKLARRHRIPYFLDAGQAVGHIPTDVQTLGCDVFKAAGRKFLRGPRGTALLFVRKEFRSCLRPVFLDANAQADVDAPSFESSEQPIALWRGLEKAVDLAHELGIHAIHTRVQQLANYLRDGLKKIPALTLLDQGPADQRSGLVSFALDRISASQLKVNLAAARINVGANGVPYTPFDMQARGLNEVVRASVHYFNTEAEVQALVTAVSTNAERSGQSSAARKTPARSNQ